MSLLLIVSIGYEANPAIKGTIGDKYFLSYFFIIMLKNVFVYVYSIRPIQATEY